MQFDSLASFLDMGGYAFFVWLSFGAVLLMLAILLWHSLFEHKHTQHEIRQRLKRDAKLRSAAQKRSLEQSEAVNEPTS